MAAPQVKYKCEMRHQWMSPMGYYRAFAADLQRKTLPADATDLGAVPLAHESLGGIGGLAIVGPDVKIRSGGVFEPRKGGIPAGVTRQVQPRLAQRHRRVERQGGRCFV